MEEIIDEQNAPTIKKDAVVTEKKKKKCVKFINISGRGFYEVLNQKIIGRR